ncbi:MAG: prolipoprotein diacylglyceryl transferase [Alphaproteobacteria bacterium]|nr:prolipoprotein diacylglyceryl transferase [Rhodospirillales bacterium]MCW9045113.1 prolipoprotein diacylglyceryl transferase [Alphaproteobacteria bacterium]
MTFVIPFPAIDPVLLSFGPLAIRWYSLAYIAGLLLGWQGIKWLVKKTPHAMTNEQVEDLILWLTFGVVLGGRLGYALFYNFAHFMENPMDIFKVWQGGMSFHGGILGVTIAGYLFTRRHKLNFLKVADVVACVSPIGLFFGRISNFINGELFGRPTDVAWAMVFPQGGPEPRHPSQLYEACLEGLLLFLILHLLWRVEAIRMKPGILTGVFLVGYASARMTVEFFREPDGIVGIFTIGQFLSIPMVILGLFLVWRGRQASPS